MEKCRGLPGRYLTGRLGRTGSRAQSALRGVSGDTRRRRKSQDLVSCPVGERQALQSREGGGALKEAAKTKPWAGRPGPLLIATAFCHQTPLTKAAAFPVGG